MLSSPRARLSGRGGRGLGRNSLPQPDSKALQELLKEEPSETTTTTTTTTTTESAPTASGSSS